MAIIAIKNLLRKFPFLFKAAYKIQQSIRVLFHINTKTVLLCTHGHPIEHIEKMRSQPEFSNVVEDLEGFTGLKTDLTKRLMLQPQYHYHSEFKWQSPQNPHELAWFYRSTQSYLFDNASHPYWKKLDQIKPEHGLILEYAGGIGHNTIPLAERGCAVDYLEIGIIQNAFVRFRINKRGLTNVTFVEPYKDGTFDPVKCIDKTYGVIILQDVLEHIPDYHLVLKHLIGCLRPGGYIFEQTPFEEEVTAEDIDIHLKASMPLDQAMVGMDKIERNVWRKRDK